MTETHHPDYGTGQKKLGRYLVGLVSCIVLTLFAFGVVMVGHDLSKLQTMALIYAAAVVQFLVQLIFFIGLNTQTPQGKTNVMTFVFTGVILVSIILGSVWIMWNLNYYMAH